MTFKKQKHKTKSYLKKYKIVGSSLLIFCLLLGSVGESCHRNIKTVSVDILTNIPSACDHHQPGLPGKFSAVSKAKGTYRRNYAKNRVAKSSTNKQLTSNRQSSGNFFADAFTVERNFLAVQTNTDSFNKFHPNLGPNQMCQRGPRSVTILSSKRNSDLSTEFIAYDGF